MKTIASYFICTIGLVLSLSCSKKDAVNEHELGKFYVSKKMAEDFVNQRIFNLYTPINSASAEPGTYNNQPNQLEKTSSIMDEQGNHVFHILTYRRGGFVVISADNRLAPILAYSEFTSFDTQSNDYPAGLVNWLSNQKERVQQIRATQSEQSAEIKAQWEPAITKIGFWPSFLPDYEFIDSSVDCATQRKQFGPNMFGRWKQECESVSGQEDRCVWYTLDYPFSFPIGLRDSDIYRRWQVDSVKQRYQYGQIIFEDKYPQKDFIWILPSNDLNNVGSLHDRTTKIIKQLHQYKVVNMLPNQVKPWLRFKSHNIKQSWYCDGYQEYKHWHGDCEKGFATYSSFLHMNWGWRGAFDGWFSTVD